VLEQYSPPFTCFEGVKHKKEVNKAE